MSKKHLVGKDKEVFDKIEEALPGVIFVDFFNSGSTARVYHVRLPFGLGNKLKVDRIIKVFRNDTEQTVTLDINKIFKNEITKLISVSHNNVISVYNAGYLRISDMENLPYYIMEFLPGARDFDKWLSNNIQGLTREMIIQLLLQAARGIEALHIKGIVHCDLKFGNMLVGKSGQLKIADLGFAKYLTNKVGKTGLYTSHKYFPTCYREYELGFQDKRQMYVELPRRCIHPSFDLHYFGKLILEIINIPVLGDLLSSSDRKGLKLIADRSDLDNPIPSLPRYNSFTQVISDLEKMQGLYLNRAGVDELSTYTGTRTIRIPVSGSIPFPLRIAELIHHPLFFRLNNVLQLGFTHYVFPGATHTRLEHSLGVYSNVSKYITSLLSDDYQPYFRQLVDQEVIVTALVAGLLHDIGQHSFSHSLEDAGITPNHETLAEMFITGKGMKEFVKPDANKEPLQGIIKAHWPEINVDRLCWLITGSRGSGQTIELCWEIVRAILSGPIDADKMDYLIRDAHHAGVEYPRSIDVTRLMNSLSASLVKDGKFPRGVLAITWKGKQSAENILLARSQMFWVLYWHHAVRSAHAMLAHACASHIQTLCADEMLSFNEILYWGSSGEFISYLKSSKSVRAKYLANCLNIRCLFKRIIELDYEDDKELYYSLLGKKEEFDRKGDKLLLELSRNVAKEINQIMPKKSLPGELTEDDIIVDIPKAGKDKLGEIYVVEKGSDVAKPYNNNGLVGSIDDWQNRVRTIRIFVDQKVDVTARERIAAKGRTILQRIT